MPTPLIPRAIRFWSKVDKGDGTGCWLWTSSQNQVGHGVFTERRGGPTKSSSAHRVAYEYLVGPIPAGLQLDHLCRNPPCVNPAHLEPVTPKENNRRANEQDGRGAYKTHCPQGHPYSLENTRVNVDPSGQLHRSCRACGNAAQKAYQARRDVNRVPKVVDFAARERKRSATMRAKYAAMVKPRCVEPGCDRETRAFKSKYGLCWMHEQRMYKARRSA